MSASMKTNWVETQDDLRPWYEVWSEVGGLTRDQTWLQVWNQAGSQIWETQGY
jgi:hypothetical protein